MLSRSGKAEPVEPLGMQPPVALAGLIGPVPTAAWDQTVDPAAEAAQVNSFFGIGSHDYGNRKR
jgi:hypothetical protein